MDSEALSILREAVRTSLRNETIERAIGRTVRRRDLDFSRYLQIMNDLRDLAKERKTTPDAVARSLAEEKCEGD